ncbi:MAG: class I SAM-dependent RNA methyltransferase [Desulfotomaculales bacterium]
MERLTLRITGMAHGGEGMGRLNGKVVFVPFTIPGELVLVRPVQEKKDYVVAEAQDILEPSPHRTAAGCEGFGRCGGCNWQHIDYSHQLELKRRIVEEQLFRIGKIESAVVRPVLLSEQHWHYRNRGDFSVNRDGFLGFKMRGTHRFVPVSSCRLMHPRINELLSLLQGKCGPGAAKKTHNVCIRYGVNTGEFLIQPFLGVSGVPTGQPFFRERLFSYRYVISAASFFQVNTLQAEQLVSVVEKYIQPRGDELVLDAYAGVGTFARALADKVGRVIAVEEAGSAVRDAALNLQDCPNVRYYRDKTEDFLCKLNEKADVVILDPPRAGCFRSALEALVNLAPEKIVYVSCDPATLARDLGYLCTHGFVLKEVQPVDMFPQTYHVECVALLKRATCREKPE